jgi:hypothetical protein
MYQVYAMLGLMIMTWGLAIWASLSEEPILHRDTVLPLPAER